MQPCVWKLPRADQEVWSELLQTVFPQQCQGDWIHQGNKFNHIHHLHDLISLPDFLFCFWSVVAAVSLMKHQFLIDACNTQKLWRQSVVSETVLVFFLMYFNFVGRYRIIWWTFLDTYVISLKSLLDSDPSARVVFITLYCS